MKKTKLLLFAIVSLLSLTSYGKHKIFNLEDYGIVPNTKENITLKLNSTLEEIKKDLTEKDRVTLQFAPGSYHFYPEESLSKTYYISNHDQDNPKKVGLALEHWHNLTVDGGGANFIFHGTMLPISLLYSENCKLKNFTLDFENPHIAQVIIESNKGEEGIVFRPSKEVSCRIADNGKLETYGDDWVMQPFTGIAFDPITRHILYNTSDLYMDTSDITDLEDGSFYAPKWIDKRMVDGTVVAMRTWYRPTPGLFLSHNINTQLVNIKVHYAQGMGLLAQMCENITLDEFSVCLKGDHDSRYFTTQADATHFSSCKGKIISKNGLYEGMMDDAINIHGTYLKVVKRVDDHTLIAKYMHPQAWGFEWGRVLDKVQFVRSETMELVGEENSITSITAYDQDEIEGAKEFMIRFKNSINKQIHEGEGYGIENLTWTPQVIFSQNTIRNNRARGALFSTPQKTIVENNLFDHTSGTAILLCGDCNGWYETGACREVIIRKNHFINALTNMFQFTNAIISIYPEIPNLEKQTKYFHGGGYGVIRIEDNIFETFDEPLLYAKSVEGLVFKNNRVIKNTDFTPFHWNKQRVFLERVSNAEIED